MATPGRAQSEDEVPLLFERVPASPSLRATSQSVPSTQLNLTDEREQNPTTSEMKRRLYISHFLSTWNSRVFEFGAVLMLAHIFEDTLLPASLYALFRAASAICLSPIVGRCVDQEDRLAIVRRSIVGQRTAVILSCAGFLSLGSGWLTGTWANPSLFAFVVILACVEKNYSIMNLLAIERDWVIVIAEATQCRLEDLNSQMRRIDLLCKLLGPLLIAFVDAGSVLWTIYVIFGTNLLSLLIEYFAISQVYRKVPTLRSKQTVAAGITGVSTVARDEPIYQRLPAACASQACTVYQGLMDYSRHMAFVPSFALSLLYLTVLSFSGQMITYLSSIGFSSVQIGLLRTLSTAIEVSATWLAPIAMKRTGPLRSGLWFINWQMACLCAAVASFWWIDKPILAASVMVAGMIASRVGLWGFDLCVQIIVQEVTA